MSKEKLSILLVEANESKARAIEQQLSSAPFPFEIRRIVDREDLATEVAGAHPDLVITGCGENHGDCLAVVGGIAADAQGAPLLMITCSDHCEAGAKSLRTGDAELLFRGNLQHLDEAIAGLLERREDRRARRARNAHQRALFDSTHDAVLFADPATGMLVDANERALELLDRSHDEIRTMHFSDLHPREELERARQAFEVANREGARERFHVIRKDGTLVPVEICASKAIEIDGQHIHFGVFRDISELVRSEARLRFSAELNSKASVLPEKDLFDFALRQAVTLTSSEIGYIHTVSDDQRTINLVTWNERAMEDCRISDDRRAYPLETAGIWADSVRQRKAVIHNDLAAAEGKGFPEGHVAVARHMSLPVVDGDKVRMVVGVGNKATDYDEVDLLHLQEVAEQVLRVVLRKRAESALRESEEKMRAMFEQASVGMALVAFDGRILKANQKLSDMLGYSQAELAKMHLQQITHADDRLRDLESKERMVRGEIRSASFEKRYLGKNGGTIWANVTIAMTRHPMPGFVMVVQDLSQRREQDRQLQELKLAVDQASDTILITTTEGILTYMNPTAERFLGYRASELLGQSARTIRTRAANEIIEDVLARHVRAGRDWHGRITRQRKDGSEVVEDVTISPIFDDAGAITRFVTVGRDVSRTETLRAQVRDSQRLEALDQLAGGIAHDFNNLLQAILANLDLARLGLGEHAANVQPELDAARSAAERAAALVRQLVTFARKQTLDLRPTDLNEVVDRFMTMIRKIVGDNVALVFEPAPNLPPIRGDAEQLQNVLTNLCTNARDAMPKGGMLRLRTELEQADDGTRHVVLSIFDTGQGMNEQTRRRVFEPFFTTKASGIGLGLAMVYGIVRQHEGTIAVQSAPGAGTEIVIRFPAHEQRGVIATGPDMGATPERPTLLLAEDDPATLNALERYLSKSGFTVITATNGEEACRVFADRRDEVDLVLLDVVMPVVGGPEAFRRMRELRPDIAALFSTGYAASAFESSGSMPAGTEVIEKPFDMQRLLAKVRSILATAKRSDGVAPV